MDERSPVGPLGLYGLSKLFGEGLVDAYSRSVGTECLTLRLGHIFGPGEERYAKLVPETIRRVLANQPPRIAGDGGEQRDLLYVDDAAEALARSCTAPLNGARIINVARGASHQFWTSSTRSRRSPVIAAPPSGRRDRRMHTPPFSTRRS